MDNIYQQKIIDANELFKSHYLDSKALYVYRFNALPSINFIDHIDGEKAFDVLMKAYGSFIESLYSYRSYDQKEKRYVFSKTILLLSNRCLLELDRDYCEIAHDGSQDDFVQECTHLVRQYKEKHRRKSLEVNLIVNNGGLSLRAMEIKRTRLNLDLFYEDDFKEVDAVIRRRLNQKNDKGIVLLHGLPGTGKTTYLRYLIGKIKKRIIFLSPNTAGNIGNPDLMDLLIEYPDSVIIVEEAESIIADRKVNPETQVSNLLNLSDGLLADFLNVQLVCTFNNTLTMIDQALLRKGRLIARYEFGKLSAKKAQHLSEHLGYDTTIRQPMTIAEVANQKEKDFSVPRVEIIGFRREAVEN